MNKSIKEISTREISQNLNNPNYQLIDVRPVDAYNGWPMMNETRGGHIKGARSLSAKWAQYIDWIEIVRKKKILPGKQLVIYGYQNEISLHIAGLFIKAGYQNVSVYNHFLDEWIPDKDLPLEKLHRYHNLVPPQWLQSHISGSNGSNPGHSNFVICHAHYRNPGDYEKGHIPGAIALNTLELESPETWNRRPPKELENNLLKHGIDANTTVILYGRFSFPDNNDPFPGSSAGHLGAIRCALIMLYAGVKDVRILNGGIQSWEDAGLEITTAYSEPTAKNDFGARIPANPQYFVDLEEAKKMLASDDADLICVRSWPEYIGERSGYNYIEKKGRIPGAIFGNCGSDAYHMENYRNLDHTILEYQDILENWQEAGIDINKHLAFYCGTGWRGSEAWLNAWLIGLPKVSVYDGGWFEWSSIADNPVETGLPE